VRNLCVRNVQLLALLAHLELCLNEDSELSGACDNNS